MLISRKRILRRFLPVALLAALVLAHPWWLARTLIGTAFLFGLQIERVHFEGYRWYHVEDIRWSEPDWSLSISTARVPQPLYWLWLRWKGEGPEPLPIVRIDNGIIEIHETRSQSDEESYDDVDIASISQQVETIGLRLMPWIPSAHIQNFSVHENEREWRLHEFHLHGAAFEGMVSEDSILGEAHASGTFPHKLHLRQNSPLFPHEIITQLTLENRDQSFFAQAEIRSDSTQADIDTVWSGIGVLPASAEINAQATELHNLLPESTPITQLSATLNATWKENNWTARLAATGEGLWDEQKEPLPVEGTLTAEGSLTHAIVQELNLTAPFATASLQQPVSVLFFPLSWDHAPLFDAEVQLDRLAIDGLSGQLSMLLRPDSDSFTRDEIIRINATATDLQIDNQPIKELRISATLESTQLILEQFHLTAYGATLDGSATLLFPTGSDQPLRTTFDASLRWGELDFQTSGHAHYQNSRISAWPDRLTAQSNQTTWLETSVIGPDPLIYDFSPNPEIHIPPLRLTGPALGLMAISGQHTNGAWQQLSLHIEQLDFTAWQKVAPIDLPPLFLSQLTLETQLVSPDNHYNWNLTILARAAETDATQEWQDLNLNVSVNGDASGMHWNTLQLDRADSPLATGQGFLPITLVATDWYPLPQMGSGNAGFSLELVPGKALDNLIRQYLKTEIQQPTVRLNLSGKPDSPSGNIEIRAARIQVPVRIQDYPLPDVTDLSLQLRILPDLLEITDARFRLANESVALQASFPLVPEDWTRLWNERVLPEWTRLSAHITTSDFPVSAIANYLPDFLMPTGFLRAGLEITPGPVINGKIDLREVSTRGLPNGSAFSQVRGTLLFDGQQAELVELSGLLGRSPVKLSGTWDFSDLQSHAFALHLTGKNLALLRSSDFILRSDADVRLTQKRNQPAELKGTFHLRDSILLRDFRGFFQPGVRTTANRPPFFSIDQEPFSNWRIQLHLHGDQFLRVQTPFFRGKISAGFELLGTLGEPFAVGEAEIEEGRVIFPFASVQLEQGTIRLLRNDPYDPLLSINGSARTLGYNLQMEVTGSAYDPILSFQANPPLSQDQALLLMTAGIMPEEGTANTDVVGQRLAFYLGKSLITDIFSGTDESWTEKLHIENTGRASDTGKDTFRIEYRVKPTLSVFAENDTFDEYNAGIRWEVFSK